jgi:hypothetical protein
MILQPLPKIYANKYLRKWSKNTMAPYQRLNTNLRLGDMEDNDDYDRYILDEILML